MRPLRQADFPRIWDEGDQRHDLDRALVLLRHGLPEWSYDELARLSIGRRDALLLQLRRCTFGSEVSFAVGCPRCGERLEDEAQIDELLLIDPWAEQPERHTVTIDGCVLEFRSADSRDLAAALDLPDDRAGWELARRCLVRAQREDKVLGFEDLDEATRAGYSDAAAEHDPQAELEFAMTCPACNHAWAVLFDIIPYLWQEVVARAKLLLHDVHELAGRYGWTESEVLALAPSRRNYYIEKFG